MFKTLQELCSIHSPSGEEHAMKEYLLEYINSYSRLWKVQPEIIHGPQLLDCLILKFGNPRLAAIAHMDTTGFTVRYENQLIPIGSPDPEPTDVLAGRDIYGEIECKIRLEDDYQLFYEFPRSIQRGTSLTYKPNFREGDDHIISPYLDNRIGIFNLLKTAETLENGLLVFSAWEEHGGGSVPILARYFYEELGVKQALISDVTWVTDGVHPGKGVAISMRDRNIPRRSYVETLIDVAHQQGVEFQVEVEGNGSSDGRELQISPYPIDWCFAGPPQEHPHSSAEKVNKYDIVSMNHLYRVLFEAL